LRTSAGSQTVRAPTGFIAHALHEVSRRNDWDSLERIEREEIGVAGDD
jgi:hypothetical protein